MARHRRDDQQLGLAASTPCLAEMLELPERLAQHDILVDRDRLLADLVSSMPNSGLPRGAEAWAKTSRPAATIGPIEP